MNEKDWVQLIKKTLEESDLGDNICVDTSFRIPYAQEVLSFDLSFQKKDEFTMPFETDLVVYEKTDVIKPRIIVEAKVRAVTTHDAIVYSTKAQYHKNVTPYVRYGIMIGNVKEPLPGRLFRHGSNFDFMICFKGYNLDPIEKSSFINLIKSEICYSRIIEELIYKSREKDRTKYYLMQKELILKEINWG